MDKPVARSWQHRPSSTLLAQRTRQRCKRARTMYGMSSRVATHSRVVDHNNKAIDNTNNADISGRNGCHAHLATHLTPSPGTNRSSATTAQSVDGTAAEPKKLAPLLPIADFSGEHSSGKAALAVALGLTHFERDSARVASPTARAGDVQLLGSTLQRPSVTRPSCVRSVASLQMLFPCQTRGDPKRKGTLLGKIGPLPGRLPARTRRLS